VDHLAVPIVAEVPAMAANTADLVSATPPTRDREERVVATSKTPKKKKKKRTIIHVPRSLHSYLNNA
jgi:hypothetical protein